MERAILAKAVQTLVDVDRAIKDAEQAIAEANGVLGDAEPTSADLERSAIIAAEEAARSAGRRCLTPLSALSHGSEDEFFSAASPDHPSPENFQLSDDSAFQSSEASGLQSSESGLQSSPVNTTLQSSVRPDSPRPEMTAYPFTLVKNRKRRRNSDSVLRETPVARGKFLSQAFAFGSDATVAYVFDACLSRLFNFDFPGRGRRQNVQVGPRADEPRPDEANGQENIDSEPVGDIDGEPFEDSPTDDE